MNRRCVMRAFLLAATSAKRQRLPSPWIDREYWLSRCAGFDVVCDDRVHGKVVAPRYDSRHDVPDGLLIETGSLFNRRVTVVPVEQVRVDAGEGVVYADG